MWTLASPDQSAALADVTIALTYSNGKPVYSLSASQRARLQKVYDLYDARLGRPASMLIGASLGSCCLEALRKAYDEVRDGGRLTALRQRLIGAARECPLCGFGEPTELDHYLPKSIYAALSVYARNLIPVCHRCNNLKGAEQLDTTRFVHAYLDKLPVTQLLYAEVTYSDALDVSYQIDALTVATELGVRISYQMDKLRLQERYTKQVNTYLFGQRTGMLGIYDAGGAVALKEYLLRSAVNLDADFGNSDWRAALMRGLAACASFCNGGVTRYFS